MRNSDETIAMAGYGKLYIFIIVMAANRKCFSERFSVILA
jgi:hypothetical protein